jgi:hypothetical protein
MNGAEDIFAAVARAASERSLPILVIGGHAVNSYGYTRTTFDVDFMICIDDLAAWRRMLESIGYSWSGQTEAFAKMMPPENAAGFLPADIMLVEHATLAKIAAESSLRDFGGEKLSVPHPLHLIALKLHAMKNPARLKAGKDLPDILHLVRICELDPKSSQFAEILQRYGNEETRALLERHFQGLP